MSRPKRWAEACSKVREGLDELRQLQEEYQEWLDNLPENLEGCALAEKLEAIIEVGTGDIEGGLEDAEAAEFPLGFGRD